MNAAAILGSFSGCSPSFASVSFNQSRRQLQTAFQTGGRNCASITTGTRSLCTNTVKLASSKSPPRRPTSSPAPSSPSSFRLKTFQGHLSTVQQSVNSSSMSLKTRSPYTSRRVGAPYTLEHRVFIEKDGVPISPFHDVPLYANEQQTILNMVIEVPRWTNAKMEVSSPSAQPKMESNKFLS